MSVLIEAVTVVIPVDTVERKLGGLTAFAANAPNRTFRSDGRLAAIGFMNPADVEVFILSLEREGLEYVRDGASIDIAVVDQFHGFAFPCAWLLLGTDAEGVKFATLAGEPDGQIAAYEGWSPDSAMIRMSATDMAIDPETGLEYMLDKRGRKLYSGRRYSQGDPHAALMLASPKLMREARKGAEEALTARGWQEFTVPAEVDPVCHLVMHLKNQLALVYVEAHWTSTIINPFTAERRARLLAEAKARRAIAVHVVCKLFAAIWMKSVGEREDANADGWANINIPQDGLRVDDARIEAMTINDAATNRPLSEKRLDLRRPIEISDWELVEFAVYLVSEKLKEDGYELEACTTAPGSEPHIIVRRDETRVRIVVGVGRYPNIDPIIDQNRLLAACERSLSDGGETAIAKVSIAAAEDAFVGASAHPLLRGRGLYSRFKGLEVINPADVFSARHVRIFVSSTFKDFERERQVLAETVLPALKRRAGARGVDVSLIDLRWGVSKADVEQAKEVAVCIREIDKAHPFFLLLLGDRYGATRDAGQLKEVLEETPWLMEGRSRLSITELELRYAMLKPNSFNPSALGFIRERGNLWGGRREILAASFKSARAALQERGYRLHAIDKDFANRVCEQLWVLIDQHYPAEEARAPGVAAMRRHKHFGLRAALLLPANYIAAEMGRASEGDARLLECRSSWEAQALAASLAVRSEGEAVTFAYHCALDPGLTPFSHRLMEFVELTTAEAVRSGRVDDPSLIANLIERLGRWGVDENRNSLISVSETDLFGAQERAVLQALKSVPRVAIVATRVSAGEVAPQPAPAPMGSWSHEMRLRFLSHYLAAHGKTLDDADADAMVRHPLGNDLSFLRFCCDHLLGAATHYTLAAETARLLRCRRFADLADVMRARIEVMCEKDDDWHALLRTLPDNGADEETWRARSKLEPLPFARSQAALAPLL